MTNGPTNLTGIKLAATRALLFRLAAGDQVITRSYAHEPGLKLAHRRGLILSRRFGFQDRLWQHEITARGTAALAVTGAI